jgi:twitching motility protein PilT
MPVQPLAPLPIPVIPVATPPVIPATLPVQPATPLNIPPVVQPSEVAEEHILMKTMPQNPVDGNFTTDASGVREFSGPPLTVQPAPSAPAMPAPGTFNIAQPVAATPMTVPAVQNAPLPLPDESKTLPTLNQVLQEPQSEGLDDLPDNKPAAIQLSGGAIGKENQVQQILNKADLLQAELKPVSQLQRVDAAGAGLKPESAGEHFYADRATIPDFLSLAEEKDASDIHLSSEYPPMLRLDGRLHPVGTQVMEPKRVKELLFSILSKEQQAALAKDLDVDFSHEHTTGTRFRVNVFYKKGNMAGAFRLIPSRIRTIAELGLPEIVYDFTKIPHGLVLVTGPTGNGKSTTLASMIQEINLNEPKHIITIEDPIEYVFPKAKSLVDQREIGTDVRTFTRALREVLRQDPNVVLVGEMRDFETISSAITVAETGHLVFSTLHTNSASQSIDRIIDVFPDAQQAQIRAQLSNVLSAIVSQRLVPISKGGRRPVMEIMIATPAVKNAIREAKTYQVDNMIQTGADIGMITLEKSLIELIRKGDLTVEEAQNYTTKPDELLSLLKNN